MLLDMVKPRVLVTPPWLHPGDETDSRLLEAGLDPIYKPWHGARTETEMAAHLAGIDGAIICLDPITTAVLVAADRLKVLARVGVGYDDIDVKTATARGIAVCTAPGVNRHAVADYTLALMLQCARKLVEHQSEVRAGRWTHFAGMDLAGKTLGIIGLGTIGKEVAQRALAFEMRLLAADPIQDQQFAEEHGVTFVPLDQLLRESDFVSLHSHLNPSSRHLINDERLALMKPTAYLINTSRGGLVDSQALYRALKEKRIAGAALDVFEEEPMKPDSPLGELDNLFVSPHIAGVTADALAGASWTAAENVIRVLRGDGPLYTVNPEALRR